MYSSSKAVGCDNSDNSDNSDNTNVIVVVGN